MLNESKSQVPMDSGLVKLKQRRMDYPIVLILALSFVLNIMGITWGLPNYLDWAIDSLAPFKVLEAAYYHFSGGWYSRYPPLHLAILAFSCAPLMGYLMLSGGLHGVSKIFPFGFVDPLSSLTYVILISRVVSLLMGVAIILLVYLTVRELFDRQSALFSALIVALYYPLVYYAHTANADVPYLFWALLSIYYYLGLLKQGYLKDYVLFALFAALSICTKDQAYGLFLFSLLPILWIRSAELRQASQQQPSLLDIFFDRRLILAAVVAVATFALAHNLIFNFSGFLKHVDDIAGPSSQPYANYAPTLLGRLQLLWGTVLQLASGLTPPLFVVCLAGSAYCAIRFPKYSLPLLLLAGSYYLTFINIVRYVPVRFVLPIAIIIAFFGGKLLAELWSKGPWRRLMRATICLAFAYAALFPIQLDLLLLGESRYAAEQWIQEHFEQGDLIETFAPHPLLKYYPRFPSWVKVRSSKIEAGTHWEPLVTRADMVGFPNLYTGREAPDYIVLSGLLYGPAMDDEMKGTEQGQVLGDFFQGRKDYTLVATFKTPTIVPIDLNINPRIDIFKRTKK